MTENEISYVKTEVPLPVVYEDEKLDLKIVLTYLKLSGKKLAILVNFNTADIAKSIFRKVNKL